MFYPLTKEDEVFALLEKIGGHCIDCKSLPPRGTPSISRDLPDNHPMGEQNTSSTPHIMSSYTVNGRYAIVTGAGSGKSEILSTCRRLHAVS